MKTNTRKKMKKALVIFSLIFTTMTISLSAQILKPGDGVRVKLLNVSDNVSGDYFVHKNSTLQLPYIGIFDANKMSFKALRNIIIQKYDSLYKNPELTVQPLFRVSILGEVNNAGVYHITGYETITDLLAIAGGETNSADMDDIYVTRNNNKIEFDAEKVLEDGETLSDINLQSGDKIFVPRTFWSKSNDASIVISALAVVASIFTIFFR